MIDNISLYIKYRAKYGNFLFDFVRHVILCSIVIVMSMYCKYSPIFFIINVILLALMQMKTFVIFHDCGHNSYSPNKLINYVVGFFTGVMTFTPFIWNHKHNIHHLTNGNVENKYNYPFNELNFISLNQYTKYSKIKKYLSKFIMHPYVFYTYVSQIYFFILNRLYCVDILVLKHKSAKMPKMFFVLMEQFIHNYCCYLLIMIFHKYGILWNLILADVIMYVLGFILFKNQHTFNPPYVVKNEKWNLYDSGLHGSSFIQVPKYLRYFTGGIEYHHIHHMNSKIPGYNLHEYHNYVTTTSNVFDNIVKLTMNDCYNNLWLTIYDENANKYLSFSDADNKINVYQNKK